ncbi:MAG: ribonuclease HI [Taibaiella sp.]|nr:ribonuclease HI [Taibaiella sp.]MBX9449180.1 ribonuclease HI [Taibaiella sp.]
MKVLIYTDGASRGNPGPGGYGIVMIYGNKRKEVAEGFRKTTNNRMELMAVIVALEHLKRDHLDVEIYSDSRYVVDAINQRWVWSWLRTGFKKKKNEDLWRRFLQLYPKNNIKMIWVKGHADNPFNNRCDELATRAADAHPTSIDHGYEENENDPASLL